MGLPARAPKSWGDLQLNFDYLYDRTFEFFNTRKPVRMSAGNTTVAFSASNFSNTVSVAHALGRVPTSVQLTPVVPGGGAFAVPFLEGSVFDATSFTVRAGTADGAAVTMNVVVYWLAVG